MLKASTLKKRTVLKKESVRRVPAGAKKVSTKLDRGAWLKLHAEATKYPLSLRIAAELWRAGVTFDLFENLWHLEESGISKAVYQAMFNFKLGKGIDPDFVPPMRATFYKIDKTLAKEERAKGRPTTEQAIREAKETCAELKKRGWLPSDICKAFRVAIGDETEEENSAIPLRRISGKSSLPTVSLSKLSKEEKSLDLKTPNKPVEPEPTEQEIQSMERISSVTPKQKSDVAKQLRSCARCSKQLGEAYCVDDSANAALFYHIGCWTISNRDSSSLVTGQCAFDPVLGSLVYYIKEKNSWVSEAELRVFKETPTPAMVTQEVPVVASLHPPQLNVPPNASNQPEISPNPEKKQGRLSKTVRPRIPGVGIVKA